MNKCLVWKIVFFLEIMLIAPENNIFYVYWGFLHIGRWMFKLLHVLSKTRVCLGKEFIPLLLFKFSLWDSLSLKWKFTILLSLAGQWALCICLILPLNTRVNVCTVIIDLFLLLKTHTVYYACYFLPPIAIQTLHNSSSIKPLAIFLSL